MLETESSLSSATRIRRPPFAAAPAAVRGPGFVSDAGEATTGSRTTSSLPSPRPPLRASTVPPCSSTSRRTIVSPMPSPPCAFSSDRSACTNGSKTLASMSRAIPAPSSATVTATEPPSSSGSTVIRTCPPGAVYFAALLSRLANTWASRVTSASTTIRSTGAPTVSRCPSSSTSGRLVSTALWTASIRSTRDRRSSILPRLIRLTSSRSSTRWTICRSWRPIVSRARSTAFGSSFARSMTRSAFRIGASGFRSSCASVARNSSLRRSASFSSSSDRLISVMSTDEPT